MVQLLVYTLARPVRGRPPVHGMRPNGYEFSVPGMVLRQSPGDGRKTSHYSVARATLCPAALPSNGSGAGLPDRHVEIPFRFTRSRPIERQDSAASHPWLPAKWKRPGRWPIAAMINGGNNPPRIHLLLPGPLKGVYLTGLRCGSVEARRRRSRRTSRSPRGRHGRPSGNHCANAG